MENLLNLHNNSDLITQNKGIEALNLLLEKYQKDEEINLSVNININNNNNIMRDFLYQFMIKYIMNSSNILLY